MPRYQFELPLQFHTFYFAGFLLKFDGIRRDREPDLSAFVFDLIFVFAEFCIFCMDNELKLPTPKRCVEP